jgi:hypothetical protein
MALTQVQSGMMDSIAQYNSFKNRIINGGMSIWQRGTSFASVAANTYLADRFFWNSGTLTGVATVSQSTDVPNGTGFPYSLLATVTAAQTSLSAGTYATFTQRIEGFNCSDLKYGTADAVTITLSFWVKSNLTGVFTGSISQLSGSPVRTFPYSFTINAANTWQQITITVPGDTSGTIPNSNATGLTWDITYMPIGTTFQTGTANTWNANVSGTQYSPTGITPTNLFATVGNTFRITGVQLEKGSTATAFDYRPYGTELQLCQRYYQILQNTSGGRAESTTYLNMPFRTICTMRTSPSGATVGTIVVRDVSGTTTRTANTPGSPSLAIINDTGGYLEINASSYSPANFSVGALVALACSTGINGIALSAEL